MTRSLASPAVVALLALLALSTLLPGCELNINVGGDVPSEEGDPEDEPGADDAGTDSDADVDAGTAGDTNDVDAGAGTDGEPPDGGVEGDVSDAGT